MPSWNDLFEKSQEIPFENREQHFRTILVQSLNNISKLLEEKNVIYYASSFLQKPNAGGVTIMREDMNAFMSSVYSFKPTKGLVLLIHTPGGEIEAVESIVEYLHKKFNDITVIIPYLAMSGGSMISLASNCIIMGKQSQIGPIDPQIFANNQYYSARNILTTFYKARIDIKDDSQLAHLWGPILHSMGPELIAKAESALKYSEQLASKWLTLRMFKNNNDAKAKANKVAKYLNAEDDQGVVDIHTHGQRIDIEILEELGVKTKCLEDDQDLQEAVLTAYNAMTLIFEQGLFLKFVMTQFPEIAWVKSATLPPPNMFPQSL